MKKLLVTLHFISAGLVARTQVTRYVGFLTCNRLIRNYLNSYLFCNMYLFETAHLSFEIKDLPHLSIMRNKH